MPGPRPLMTALIFKSRLTLIIQVNVIPNRTVVVDSDWRFDNLCCSHLQSQSELYHASWWYYTLVIRELKNHDDSFVSDDQKWDTVHCTSAASKFRHCGVVDNAKQSRITLSCNPRALAGINPLFLSDFWSSLHFFIFLNSDILPIFS